jgi:sulfofructose kinase
VLYTDEILSPGGQVASAIVCCAKLGLRSRYIGVCGDDERGRVQMESLREAGIDTTYVQIRPNCETQSAYILIDQSTGERTVLWKRPACLQLSPDAITEEMVTSGRLLHIDGHDTEAVGKAASIARAHGIPVTADVDTIYHGFDRVLPQIDYLITSSEFPSQWTGEADPFKALERMQEEYGMRVAAMTLGAHGALARYEGRFHYSPAYVVNCVDTTGAGDTFHGAFCYGVLEQMGLRETLDLANALAALNCTAAGARGGLATRAQAEKLMQRAERRILNDLPASLKAELPA